MSFYSTKESKHREQGNEQLGRRSVSWIGWISSKKQNGLCKSQGSWVQTFPLALGGQTHYSASFLAFSLGLIVVPNVDILFLFAQCVIVFYFSPEVTWLLLLSYSLGLSPWSAFSMIPGEFTLDFLKHVILQVNWLFRLHKTVFHSELVPWDRKAREHGVERNAHRGNKSINIGLMCLVNFKSQALNK